MTRGPLVLGAAILAAALAAAGGAHAQAVLENPTPASSKSGIGLLSGWKCSAAGPSSITLTIDGGTPVQAAYGTSRTDTVPICGDANNGFGALFNFGLLAEGEHETVARDGGTEFARATFTTSRFGVAFLSGASGVSFARDFPAPDQGAFLVWEESSQSFTVGGTCGFSGRIACPPAFSQTGWATADQESAGAPYFPTNSINSFSEANSVLRFDPGVYRVTMGNLGVDGPGGIVHVTARQDSARSCNVESWNENAGNRIIDVRCFDAAGAPADARFDVAFTRPGPDTGLRAFLWADQPEADAYVPQLAYQYNATGAVNTVTRSAPGTYRAVVPGIAAGAEVGVMLTTYAAGPARCRIADWNVGSDGRFGVDVLCQDEAGTDLDAAFTLSVLRRTVLAPIFAVNGAYVRVRNPAEPTIDPDESFNSRIAANTVSRLSDGRYSVLLGSFGPFGAQGNAHVVAVGATASHCKVESVASSGDDAEVIVRCFAGAVAVDSGFALTYME